MSHENAPRYITVLFFLLWLPQIVVAGQDSQFGNRANYVQLYTENDQSFSAYVVGPQQAKQAILLIHGWWGLNRDVETWANQFAVAGYRVIAVDLYNQQVTTNPKKARELMDSVVQHDANTIYAAAIKSLSSPGRKIAIVGRSYGASQALHAAYIAQEKASATIVYYPYGELITDKEALQSIKTPILGHFARDDFFLTADKAEKYIASLNNSGLDTTAITYKAKHGFDKPESSNFDEPSHKQSLEKTYQFLNKHLN